MGCPSAPVTAGQPAGLACALLALDGSNSLQCQCCPLPVPAGRLWLPKGAASAHNLPLTWVHSACRYQEIAELAFKVLLVHCILLVLPLGGFLLF